MIEEEDEDAILNQGTSWKKVLKHIAVILIILLGVAIIYTPIIKDEGYRWITGFMIICFGSSLLQIQREAPEPIKQTLTITQCKKCNKTIVRHYEEGDFVYKKIDECNKCNIKMEITQIYSVKLKGPTITPKKGNLTMGNP